MPRKPGRIIIIVVTTFWLVMMGLLVYREVLEPRWRSLDPSFLPNQPLDVWMGIFLGGDERVGFVHLRSTPQELAGVEGARLDLMLRLTLSLLGRETVLSVSGWAFQSQEAGISTFDFSVRSGEHEMRLVGEVAGKVLKARMETAGETIPFTLPVQDSLMLGGPTGLGAVQSPVLKPGQVLYADSFDPTTMGMGRARLEGVGEEVLEVRGESVGTYIVSAELGGIRSRAWVTAEGEVVRAETPFGFQLRAIAPEEALAPVTPSEQASLIRRLAVQVSGLTPVRDATLLTMRLSGVAEDELPQASEWQRREGQVFTVSAPEDIRDVPQAPLSPEETQAYLSSDPFITADHPRIQEASAEIIGEAQDPWERALRIYEWTYESIDKASVISVPNALEVLRTRVGDCNEHTILFAALARAAGIPTRVAIGLVYGEEIGGFGYHAWPEVHVGGWIPMDPTLGQVFADATHLKLLEGSIEQWTRLIPYIGKLQIEVLEITHGGSPGEMG